MLLAVGIGAVICVKGIEATNIQIQQSEAHDSRARQLDARTRELKSADSTLANLESRIQFFREQIPELEAEVYSRSVELRNLTAEIAR